MIHNSQIRYFTPDGKLTPTPIEAAESAREEAQAAHKKVQASQEEIQVAQAQAQAAQEKTQAAQAQAQATQQKNDLLVAKLRQLGVDTNAL